MRCESCNEREATIAFTRIAGDDKQVLHLCANCAESIARQEKGTGQFELNARVGCLFGQRREDLDRCCVMTLFRLMQTNPEEDLERVAYMRGDGNFFVVRCRGGIRPAAAGHAKNQSQAAADREKKPGLHQPKAYLLMSRAP